VIRAVDFDKTLATMGDWRGQLVLGEPVRAMVERVQQWLDDGDEVFIYTARIGDDNDRLFDAGTEATVAAIQDWCERNVGVRLPVRAKAHFNELYDDRVVQVFPNTGLTVLDVLRRRQREENSAGKTYASSVLREVIAEIERLTAA
jgi:hypothetical protein